MAGRNHPNAETRKKTRSKKKQRTVNISSSSESDNESDNSPALDRNQSPNAPTQPQSAPTPRQNPKPITSSPQPPPSQSTAPKPQTSSASVDEAFTAVYLRKATAELADDLDKVREANDFKSSSLPMLVRALSQGVSMYGVEERRGVVEAGREA